MASSVLALVDVNAISMASILLSMVLLVASYASYQIFFHPLRRYPGPLLAKVSSGYGIYYVWRKCFHLVMVRLHQQYGPVVRLSPDRLVFNSATAIRDIYNNPRVTKGRAYLETRQSGRGAPNLFNVLNKDEHRAKRRMIGPVVGESSMRVFEPEMIKQVDSFLRELLRSSRNTEVVNMTPRCERLGVDVIGQLAFGYQLDTQVEPTHRVMVEGMKNRGDRNSLYFFSSSFRYLEKVFNLVEGSNSLDGFYKSVQTMIRARMALPKDAKHDFYSLASGESAGESGLISKDFWAEAVFLVAAGGSTTATAMSGVFFYLSRNPDAYKRVASEIRTVFNSGQDIVQGPRLNNCKYLRAVIEETMRMSPSTLGHAWREQDPASVAAGESFVVDGHLIPPGTQVASSNYCLQHNEAYFPEPYKFRPERWLESETDDKYSPGDGAKASQQNPINTIRRAFIPFSIGDRACAGKAMAWLEMRLAVAKTLWYFDFERAPGEAGKLGGGREDATEEGRNRVDEFQLYESIVVDHTGPNLMFTPRGDFWRDLEGSKE